MRYTPKLVTLIYCVKDDQVLLAKRKKAPYIGYWVAPGGKIEPGESPHEGAVRELQEETGLSTDSAELRAVVSETSPNDDWQWLMFIYRVTNPMGEVVSDEREGELRWFDVAAINDIKMPDADRQFVPYILSPDPGIAEFRFHYDQDINLIQTHRWDINHP